MVRCRASMEVSGDVLVVRKGNGIVTLHRRSETIWYSYSSLFAGDELEDSTGVTLPGGSFKLSRFLLILMSI